METKSDVRTQKHNAGIKPALSASLQAAGKQCIRFRGDSLHRMCQVLEGAAAVLPRHGDRAADVRAFKLACAINYSAVYRAVQDVQKQIRAIMADPADWHKGVAAWLQEKSVEILEEPIPPDIVLMAYFEDEDALNAIVVPYGKEAADKLMSVVKQRFCTPIDQPFCDTCLDRKNAMKRAGECASRVVPIDVQMILWDKVPGALSGGYLRDLSWMFVELPPEIESLRHVAKSAADLEAPNAATPCPEIGDPNENAQKRL